MSFSSISYFRAALWGSLIGFGVISQTLSIRPFEHAVSHAAAASIGGASPSALPCSEPTVGDIDLGGPDSPFAGQAPALEDSVEALRTWPMATAPSELNELWPDTDSELFDFQPNDSAVHEETPVRFGPRGAVETRAANGKRILKVRRICRVTAYCDRGTTASGRQSGVGQCAAPGDIPFGAKVYIPSLGKSLVVTDRTHRRFRHNTVDVFIPSKSNCLQFGRRYVECEFTIELDDEAPGNTFAAR